MNDKDQTIEELARGICALSANRGNCEQCGFAETKSCTNYCIAQLLYRRGFRKTGEVTEGKWIKHQEQNYTYYRCSICNDWQMKRLPVCYRCYSSMKLDLDS